MTQCISLLLFHRHTLKTDKHVAQDGSLGGVSKAPEAKTATAKPMAARFRFVFTFCKFSTCFTISVDVFSIFMCCYVTRFGRDDECKVMSSFKK